jgi:hypothetical protein
MAVSSRRISRFLSPTSRSSLRASLFAVSLLCSASRHICSSFFELASDAVSAAISFSLSAMAFSSFDIFSSSSFLSSWMPRQIGFSSRLSFALCVGVLARVGSKSRNW